jgi:hypothetical protein
LTRATNRYDIQRHDKSILRSPGTKKKKERRKKGRGHEKTMEEDPRIVAKVVEEK